MPAAGHILSFADYAAIRHASPYVVDVRREAARLVLFGIRHSSDPGDATFDLLERTFTALAPDFALHEGTPPAVEPEREVAIRRHGEAGLVRHLAARAGIETASMDIPLRDEAAILAGAMPAAEALVFLVVRQLASFNRKTARMDFDAYFGEFFDLIAAPLGFAAIDWPLVERQHLDFLGTPLHRQRVTGLETDPTRDQLPTQRIATFSNRLRDEHMLRRLVEAVDEHGRVFATVGVTHAVMLEPALRAAFGDSARS
jgi:hypothetical protein